MFGGVSTLDVSGPFNSFSKVFGGCDTYEPLEFPHPPSGGIVFRDQDAAQPHGTPNRSVGCITSLGGNQQKWLFLGLLCRLAIFHGRDTSELLEPPTWGVDIVFQWPRFRATSQNLQLGVLAVYRLWMFEYSKNQRKWLFQVLLNFSNVPHGRDTNQPLEPPTWGVGFVYRDRDSVQPHRTSNWCDGDISSSDIGILQKSTEIIVARPFFIALSIFPRPRYVSIAKTPTWGVGIVFRDCDFTQPHRTPDRR